MTDPLTASRHTCGFWCHDGQHALPCLTGGTTAASTLLQQWQEVLPRAWHAVAARRAPEASLAEWHRQHAWWTSTGTRRRPQEIPDDLVGWLVWIIRREEHR